MTDKPPVLDRMLVVLAVACTTAAAALASPAELTEADLEVVLSKGKIVRKEEIGSGVSKPIRLWIERDGITVSAAYKDIDLERRGVTRFASGNVELNFSDSYKYERAAYLLDRRLGLGMVPVTVVRELYRKPGAVSLWIGDSITEQERIEQDLRPDDSSMADFVHQKADMRLFDALIYNTDRHAGNQLYTLDDWRLHLIDHSRSFRTRDELPEGFREAPVTMTRELFDILTSLEEKELRKLLKRELGPTQIRSLLARRNLIVEKFESDRQTYGDAFAFREERP